MWRDVEWRDRMLDEPEVWGVEDIGVGRHPHPTRGQDGPARAVERLPRAAGARSKGAFDAAGVRLPVQQQQITYEMGGSPPPPGVDAMPPDPGGS